MSVELATAYINLVPSAKGLGAAVASEASAAGAVGGKGFAASFAKFAKIGPLIALAAGAGLAKLGSEFDEAYDKIRVGTGATGAAFDDLKQSAKDVLKETPASIDDVGTAIADLNTRLGLTGKPLEDLSEQFLDLSRITDTDLTTNVDNLTRVFGDSGLKPEEFAGALDKVYRASQASGAGLDDLSTSAVQFGAPLRNLGFTLDDSLALLAVFNKTGVNTEGVMAGLKQGVGRMAKAGEDVPTTFRRVVDEITAMGPGSEATGKAIELFGQRAGPDLADAIAGGKFEIDDMLSAITDGSDTISAAAEDTESFGEKFSMLKNRALVGLEPLASRVFDSLGNGMDWVTEKAAPFLRDLMAVFNAEGLSGVASRLGEMWDKAWPVIQERMGVLWERVKVWTLTVGLPALGDGIKAGASALWQWVQDAWPEFAKKMGEFWGKAVNWVATVGLPAVGTWLKETGGPALWQWIQDAWPPFAKKMGEFWGKALVWLGTVAVPWLIKKGHDLTQALTGWLLTEAVPSIIRGLFSLRQAMQDWFTQTAIPWLLKKAGEWFGQLRKAAVDKAGDLMDYMRSLPRRILSVVGDMGSTLFNSGKQLIQGLIDGIWDKFEALKRAIGRVAETVTDFWPFSPAKTGPLRSKPPEMWGRNIMGLLSDGIDAGAGDVWGSMGAVAGGMSRAVTPTLPRISLPTSSPVDPLNPAAGRGGPVTVVHTQASDPQAVAAELSWQMARN